MAGAILARWTPVLVMLRIIVATPAALGFGRWALGVGPAGGCFPTPRYSTGPLGVTGQILQILLLIDPPGERCGMPSSNTNSAVRSGAHGYGNHLAHARICPAAFH